MKIMIFDTETTSLPAWQLPSDDPSQPHLCQYVHVLCDGSIDNELDYTSLIIRPDGWIIPDGVAKLHGITQEIATKEGVPEREAVAAFIWATQQADLVCAYGIHFDYRIMRIAMMRAGYNKATCDAVANATRQHCVMQQATPFARIPPTDKMMARGRKTWKTPNLSEAVGAILQDEVHGAHDARADVLATTRLYFHMNPGDQPWSPTTPSGPATSASTV